MTLQKLMSMTRKGIDDFQMIESGDTVCVCVSGGKDSLALVTAMAGLAKFHPTGFQVKALTADLGFPEADYSPIARYMEELGVEYHVEKTDIGSIVFDTRKEKNPCSLCSKMKRAVLCETALKMGANKIALAHHRDDLIETFLMNLFYAGRIDTFLPVTELDKTGITVIRPFLYAEEKELVYFTSKNPMPVCPSGCPADKNTTREDIKELIRSLAKENPDIKAKIFGAVSRSGLLSRRKNDTITL